MHFMLNFNMELLNYLHINVNFLLILYIIKIMIQNLKIYIPIIMVNTSFNHMIMLILVKF